MVVVNIFLFCYNESTLLPHTVEHYRRYIPDCKITVMDNISTDNSVEIAHSLGCRVISFHTFRQLDEIVMKYHKDHCGVLDGPGWVIVADMDEWLCVSQQNLQQEEDNGTTILVTLGYNIVGESTTVDLSDIDLHKLNSGVLWGKEGNKNICFRRPDIKSMRYSYGAHLCRPEGTIVASRFIYLLKHMSMLGMEHLVMKYKERFDRSQFMRDNGYSGHYTDDRKKVETIYSTFLSKSTEVVLSEANWRLSRAK